MVPKRDGHSLSAEMGAPELELSFVMPPPCLRYNLSEMCRDVKIMEFLRRESVHRVTDYGNRDPVIGRLDFHGVEITTVDSVQGREKEVVILLTTKTDFDPDSTEFLDDYRRLNVAISRCRSGHFIIGHAPALRTIPTWNQVLEWAESINAIVPNIYVGQYLRNPNLPPH
ncbi:hypothetical protein TELCIR_12737 [Teladorsagia circumcincta]|uniref:DNA2/NAM7 helicase-like C-terminal domain-containing protein n=1 Tax=Teladorsagia circumcincta TaxID=45464 RepID=A0A2G9U5S0_TELCI|nr:hypothetical protein TELCIR_12737 [Teladorsagia circumcincta]